MHFVAYVSTSERTPLIGGTWEKLAKCNSPLDFGILWIHPLTPTQTQICEFSSEFNAITSYYILESDSTTWSVHQFISEVLVHALARGLNVK